jgi:hypothetical protein
MGPVLWFGRQGTRTLGAMTHSIFEKGDLTPSNITSY